MFARVLPTVALLLIFIFSVESQLDPFNKNLFVTLWDEISALVTPKFGDFTTFEKPPELFLMSMPGMTILADDYNETFWRTGNFEGTDPEYLLANMVDTIPAVAPYFVDSGRRVSIMYKRFIHNYYTKANSSSNSQEQYNKALAKIFKTDTWGASTLVTTVYAARDVVRETFSRLNTLRKQCLQNEAFAICSRKAVYWQEELDDQNLMYMVAHRELMGSQAQVLALQVRNIDNIVTNAMQKYISSQRNSVGLKSFLGDYMTTRFDPSDFWCWFQNSPDGVCKTQAAAFADVSINIKSSSVASSSAYTKAAFKSSAEPQTPLFGIKGVTSTDAPSQQNFDATASGSNIQIQFKIASVKIFREWFDPSLFDLFPLGVSNVKYSAWSDGNYEGQFPWYITKLIVAKSINITMDSWSSDIAGVIGQVATDPSLKANYGPFSFASTPSKYGNGGFSFSSKSLVIQGPQIIGYTVTKLPVFPNYEDTSAMGI